MSQIQIKRVASWETQASSVASLLRNATQDRAREQAINAQFDGEITKAVELNRQQLASVSKARAEQRYKVSVDTDWEEFRILNRALQIVKVYEDLEKEARAKASILGVPLPENQEASITPASAPPILAQDEKSQQHHSPLQRLADLESQLSALKRALQELR